MPHYRTCASHPHCALHYIGSTTCPRDSRELYSPYWTMKQADKSADKQKSHCSKQVGVSHSENNICKLMPSTAAGEYCFRVNLYTQSTADCLKPENFLVLKLEGLLSAMNKFFSLLLNCSMVFVLLPLFRIE